MDLVKVNARTNWRARVREVGYLTELFFDNEQKYWPEIFREPFAFWFSEDEIDQIDTATSKLYEVCMQMVELILGDDVPLETSNNFLRELAIPEGFWDLLRSSYRREQPEDHSLYGRFDLVYTNGRVSGLEFNSDTPTFLCEMAQQWAWLIDLKREGHLPESSDQFNSFDIKLKHQFEHIAREYGLRRDDRVLHFIVTPDEEGNVTEEEVHTCELLMHFAALAGINCKLVAFSDVSIDREGFPCDADSWQIRYAFKLYPWENIWYDIEQHMDREDATHLKERFADGSVRFIEPMWKAILSNKGIWALIWRHFGKDAEYQEFLLPTFFEKDMSLESLNLRNSTYVRKPIIGREGSSVQIIDSTAGVLDGKLTGYGREGFVIQELCSPEPVTASLDNKLTTLYPIIGSWIIGGETAGMDIRAGGLITSNTTLFVPHYFSQSSLIF